MTRCQTNTLDLPWSLATVCLQAGGFNLYLPGIGVASHLKCDRRVTLEASFILSRDRQRPTQTDFITDRRRIFFLSLSRRVDALHSVMLWYSYTG